MKKFLFVLPLVLPAMVFAEEDGGEFLEYMRRPELRETAQAYVDAARKEWDGTLFCIRGDDPQKLAFDAVRQYLETHPGELSRPRRYLIIQGLRAGHPCKP